MSTILAIDPGRDTGWAVINNPTGNLVECGLGGLDEPRRFSRWADFVVIECPQVYDRTRSKGDPNDLITLAIQVGQYKERFGRYNTPVALVLPAIWKGQVPKQIHNQRMTKSLTDHERALLPALPQTKLHNVIDAIGLGKWAHKHPEIWQ